MPRETSTPQQQEETMLYKNRRDALKLVGAAALVGASSLTLSSVAKAADIRVAMVVKALGIGFFDACRDGGEEAAKEAGGVELIYTGPTKTTAEEQIAVIDSLIAQKVDAIAISANDPNALVPVCKKAMERGIKVISFDSGVAPEGRIMHLNPSNNALIGSKCVQMIAKTINNEGEVAILSATAQATNQNIWIEEMKKEWAKPEYAKMTLVTTVYGDDVADKSYREMQGLIKAYPNLKGVIAPTSVGIVAAAKAVVDAGLVGKVFVSGLGLPSEMKSAVLAGATDTFAIWNPIDLGYSATMIAIALVRGAADGKPGSKVTAGRMGEIAIGDNGDAAMADPFTFDKSNIEKFAAIF
jgi:rhamnose transport system substrate-binding protein